MSLIRARLRARGGEDGLTLIELLVASAMSVILVGAVGSMLVSAVRSQPEISERSQNVSTARWVLERMTREIRNGIAVNPEKATGSSVSFTTRVRRVACGGGVEQEAQEPARVCQVTYTCTSTAPPAGGPSLATCSRVEADPGVYTGTTTTVVEGLSSSNVFNYAPSASEASYIGVTLRIPNPDGSGTFTVSDGATLRTPSFIN